MVPGIRRPPAQQAREDPISDGGGGPVRSTASLAGLMNISEGKGRLRHEAESSRHRLGLAGPDAARAISDVFHQANLHKPNATVSGYIAARGEADPLHLMKSLSDMGCILALPRIAEKDKPLIFHLWRADEAPVESAFGVMEAAADWPVAAPDVLLVPLLGFDSQGYRLGYGGGFYDRTLQALRKVGPVLAVGIAFSGQEMILPHDENDERLDWIVTEKFARQFAH